MEHMLRAPPSAAVAGSGLVYQETADCHLEEDDELIARLASSSASRPTIPSWQSDLSLLASELVKVIRHPLLLQLFTEGRSWPLSTCG